MQTKDYLKKNNHIVKDVWININCNKQYFRNEVDLFKLLEGNPIDVYYGCCNSKVEYIKSSCIDIEIRGRIWIKTFSLIELENLYKDYLNIQFEESIYHVDTQLYFTSESLEFEDIKRNGYRQIIEMEYDVLSFDDFCENNLRNWLRLHPEG